MQDLKNSELSPVAMTMFAAAAARWFPEATRCATRQASAIAAKFLADGGVFPGVEIDYRYDAIEALATALGPARPDVDEETQNTERWTSRIEAALVLGVTCGVQIGEIVGGRVRPMPAAQSGGAPVPAAGVELRRSGARRGAPRIRRNPEGAR